MRINSWRMIRYSIWSRCIFMDIIFAVCLSSSMVHGALEISFEGDYAPNSISGIQKGDILFQIGDNSNLPSYDVLKEYLLKLMNGRVTSVTGWVIRKDEVHLVFLKPGRAERLNDEFIFKNSSATHETVTFRGVTGWDDAEPGVLECLEVVNVSEESNLSGLISKGDLLLRYNNETLFVYYHPGYEREERLKIELLKKALENAKYMTKVPICLIRQNEKREQYQRLYKYELVYMDIPTPSIVNGEINLGLEFKKGDLGIGNAASDTSEKGSYFKLGEHITPGTFIARGDAFAAEGKFEEAEHQYKIVLRYSGTEESKLASEKMNGIKEKQIEYFFTTAKLMEEQGEFSKAKASLMNVIEKYPGTPDTERAIATIKSLMEQSAKATEEKKKLEVEKLLSKAKSFLEIGELERALEEVRKALEINPANSEALKIVSSAELKMAEQIRMEEKSDVKKRRVVTNGEKEIYREIMACGPKAADRINAKDYSNSTLYLEAVFSYTVECQYEVQKKYGLTDKKFEEIINRGTSQGW